MYVCMSNINIFRIGPQQQHEPHEALGEKCALFFPIVDSCPTQGCATYDDITLRNVSIIEPWLSGGVILGNTSNPMTNIVFDGVTITRPGSYPFGPGYHCESASGWTRNSHPVPDCLTPR